MVKNTPDETLTQLDFFNKLDRLKVGELLAIPVSNSEIGGELLNILSKGLYTNPLDAIREYVQNSIDADADEVEIQVTGNSVFIFDRGAGMDRDELLQAREFGVSKKAIEENVGFRGIGIYSGFDLCDRLVVRSKKKGEAVQHVLEFDFKEMRDILDAARKDPQRPTHPLTSLLSDNTYYHYERVSDKEESFTIVQLLELSDTHIHRLSDIDLMQDYILRNLPIRFSDDFEYAHEIEESLRQFVPGYKSARVILRVESAEPVVVEKPNIVGLEPPLKNHVLFRGKPVAYYWACLVSGSDAISSSRFEKGEFKDFAGLAYKIKGFTIGNRDYLRKYVTRLYNWWTGEIYVIDTNVIPTSARDDFEAGPAKDKLEAAVQELLNGSENEASLQKIALNAQSRRRADTVISEVETEVEQIEEKINSGDFDQFEVYATIEDLLTKLKRHRSKATDSKKADRLIDAAKNFQQKAKEEIDQPTPVAERKRDAAKAALKSVEESSDNRDHDRALVDMSPGDEDRPGENVNTEEPKQNNLAYDIDDDFDADESGTLIDDEEEEFDQDENHTLASAIENSGWTVCEEDAELIEVIGEAIIDLLGSDTMEYTRLMQDIEERLTELLEEEG